MKKLRILMGILFISTFFISCSSNDDATDTIIGKWQIEQRFEDIPYSFVNEKLRFGSVSDNSIWAKIN